MTKLKQDNKRIQTKDTDFNYTDLGYTTQLAHEVRLNKRPYTAEPKEKFGEFTHNVFNLNENAKSMNLTTLLSLQKQNVLLVDMRGDGDDPHKEFSQYHMIGSVSFPHCWLNRTNTLQAIERFKNLDHKVIVVFMDNERHGTHVAKILTEKGFSNIYLLTGGIQ